MTKKETIKAIRVMRHYANGGKVEIKIRHKEDRWDDCSDPFWNFEIFDYRIKPESKLRPYNAEEFLKAQKEHGPYLQELNSKGRYFIPDFIGKAVISYSSEQISYKGVLDNYIWQDDSPCGIMEK